jgi:hypothetical protein
MLQAAFSTEWTMIFWCINLLQTQIDRVKNADGTLFGQTPVINQNF